MGGDDRSSSELGVGFGFFLLARGSAWIYLQPSSSWGVAAFLPKGEVVFVSESRSSGLPLLRGGCGCAGRLDPFTTTPGSSSQNGPGDVHRATPLAVPWPVT